MSNCRSCGAGIKWMKTRNGKWIPVDIETVGDPEAEVFDHETMTAHFTTCPEADKHRKGKES